MSIDHEPHEPILECDCRDCAIAARESFKDSIYKARSVLARLVHAQHWTRDSESYVAALDEARQLLSSDALGRSH